MNCFEATRDFASFWRRTLAAERRQALLDHLGSCARCDRAFRVFALTAPVLRSESEPWETTSPGASFGRAKPRRTLRRSAASRGRRWPAVAAAVAVFLASGLAAYLSVEVPVGDLTDAFRTPQPTVEMFGEQVSAPTYDRAG